MIDPKAESALPIAALFDVNVEVVQMRPRFVPDLLYREERVVVAGAVWKRQAEFGTARVCAREALARLGVAAGPLVPWPDRSPRWPNGVVGSISHTEDLCAVVVSRSSEARGLGLDVEEDMPLSAELGSMICTDGELGWISSWDVDAGRLSKLVFSAKEAVYKCQYPITKTMLDFLDVELGISVDTGTFRVRAVHRSGPQLQSLRHIQGRFCCGHGLIATAATLPR